MKRRILLGAGIVVATVLVSATPAVAKGTTTVTVKGPALAEPISLHGSGAADLNRAAGLYQTVWDQPGAVILSRRPAGRLGPRYLATYGWLVGQDRTKPVRQELYPFAHGGALSYTPPGQRVYATGPAFKGGWYRAGQPLTDLLVSLGMPVHTGASAEASESAQRS